MEYIGILKASEKWGVSLQTALKYCKNGMVIGAFKRGKAWAIPQNAEIELKKKPIPRSFKFIDLFCGIGGFHQALRNLGGTCVFACDINERCRQVYKKNFCQNDEFPVMGDIQDAIEQRSIPQFDVLCGGFPCQTFSKAGLQNGFQVVENRYGEKDERGQLFYRIIDILKEHQECNYIILENVRNLADKKDNWSVICNELKKQGFVITEEPIIVSPHLFGIPQVRERVFILGVKKSAIDARKSIPKGYLTRELLHIDSYIQPLGDDYNCLNQLLDEEVDSRYCVSQEIEELLNIWDDFRQNVKGLASPFWIHKAGIGIYSRNDYLSDTVIDFTNMPLWKQKLVMKSRIMYENNTTFIDKWIADNKMLERNLIHQKFEWNAGPNYKSIKDCIVQIRQSGIRVKRPNFFPSLVVMKNTPIVWDRNLNRYRFITPREAAKLQSFDSDFTFSESDSVTYEQLGNSVNVKLVSIFANELLSLGKKTNRHEGKTNE